MIVVFLAAIGGFFSARLAKTGRLAALYSLLCGAIGALAGILLSLSVAFDKFTWQQLSVQFFVSLVWGGLIALIACWIGRLRLKRVQAIEEALETSLREAQKEQKEV